MQAAEGVSVVNTIQNSIRKIVPSELSFCSWRWLRQINIFKYSYECKHSTSIRKYLMVLNSVSKKGPDITARPHIHHIILETCKNYRLLWQVLAITSSCCSLVRLMNLTA